MTKPDCKECGHSQTTCAIWRNLSPALNISFSSGFTEQDSKYASEQTHWSLLLGEKKGSLVELRTKLSIKKENKCFGADEAKPCMAARTLRY